MYKKLTYLLLCVLFFSKIGFSQIEAKNKTGDIKISLSENGNIKSLFLYPNSEPIEFRNDEFAGPALQLNGNPLSQLVDESSPFYFTGENDSLFYSMKYVILDKSINIVITCLNKTEKELNDLQFTLQLGINTAMKKYPEWRSTFFPTLMRCEKTHFWGYLMNPNGRIISVTSPDPIASYRLMYNNSDENFNSGHLIRTVNLDLLNPGPLPERHMELSGQLLPKKET